MEVAQLAQAWLWKFFRPAGEVAQHVRPARDASNAHSRDSH
jgi:hypothetical protein